MPASMTGQSMTNQVPLVENVLFVRAGPAVHAVAVVDVQLGDERLVESAPLFPEIANWYIRLHPLFFGICPNSKEVKKLNERPHFVGI